MSTTIHPVTSVPQVEAMRAGLDALQAWADAHPEREIIHSTGTRWLVCDRTAEPAEIVRELMDGAPIGSIEKKPVGEGLHVRRDFPGDVMLTYVIGDRERVCTRRVVGTETVEIPDPDAAMVTVEREIVEWDCEPILAGSDA